MLLVSEHRISDSVIAYIEANRHRLTPDFSTYANQRMRAWIGAEGPLSNNQSFQVAAFSYTDPLWIWLEKFCKQNLNFIPEVALLHVGGADCSDPEDRPTEGRGGECGIKMHRDAGYADFKAVGINLIGEATFGYRDCYGTLDRWSPNAKEIHDTEIQWAKMVRGTCVTFNCKNPHFAQVGPNRWCINAWRISKNRRDDYNRFLKEHKR